MKCPICKKNIHGNEKYCAGCGIELNLIKDTDSMQVNISLLEKLKLAHETLIPIYKKTDELYEIEMKNNSFRNYLNEKLKLNGNSFQLYACVIGLLLILNLISAIVNVSLKNILFLVGGSIYILFNNWKKKQNTEDKQKIDDLQNEINVMMSKDFEKISIIPDDYMYPLSTKYIIKVVSQGRAVTLNKALEMCDQEMHRMRMEHNQAQIIEEQTKQSRMLSKIMSRL